MDLQLEYFKEGFDIVALTKFFGIREDMPLPDFYTRFEDLQARPRETRPAPSPLNPHRASFELHGGGQSD